MEFFLFALFALLAFFGVVVVAQGYRIDRLEAELARLKSSRNKTFPEPLHKRLSIYREDDD